MVRLAGLLFLIAVALFVPSAAAFSATPITITAQDASIDLLRFADAADGRIAAADVLAGKANFVPYSAFAQTAWPVTMWLRFRLAAAPPNLRPQLIVLPRWIESASLYRAGRAPLTTGMYVPAAERPSDVDPPAFPIEPGDFGGAPLLMHIVYYPDEPLRVTVWSDHAMLRADWGTVLIEGIFVGMLLAVVLVNLYVYATVGDKNALYYVFYLGALIFALCSTADFADHFLWTNLRVSTRLLQYAAEILTVIAFFAFVRSFLNTKAEAPMWHRVIVVYLWVYAIVHTIQALAPHGDVLIPIVLALELFGIMLGFVLAVVRFLSRFTPARYFLIGFIPMALGVSSSIIYRHLQPDPNGPWFLAENGTELGVIFQAIVLSFSIADRLKLLEHLQQRTRRELEQMESLALTDTLTGLPNRIAFTETVERVITKHREDRRSFALLYCDLDGFKIVNDRFGHHAGDEVLRIVARRLLGIVRAEDFVCRFGGDEFVLLLDGMSGDRAAGIIDAVIAAVSEPIVIVGSRMPIGISIGLAVFPDEAATPDELLGLADQQMYASKQRRKASGV